MGNLLQYIGLRHMGFRPIRTLLTSLGVALGVALFVAIQIINRSTLESFKESIESTAGKAQLVVSGGETGFPEEKLKIVADTPGVWHAVPMVETRAYFAGIEKTEPVDQSLYILGVDLLKEQSVRTYKVSNEQVIDDPLIFLNQPDSIIITHSFADKHHLKIDSPFEIATSHGKKRLVVRGLLNPEGPAKAYGGALGIMDIDGAQASFSKEGRLDRIDVVPRENVDVDSLGKDIEKALGNGYKAERPKAQVEGMSHLVQSYQAMLAFFSSLALLVGVFLVTNSIAISVAERRREIGVLRALGATRSGILALFLAEAFIMGVVGSSWGILLGKVLSLKLMGLVSQSLSAQYLMAISIHKFAFGMSEILKGLAVGTGASVAAAFLPSLRATSIQPLEAMKKSDNLDAFGKHRSFLGPMAWAGALIMLHLKLASDYRWGTHVPFLDELDGVLGIIGPALVGPALVALFIFAFRKISSRFGGTVSRLAQDNLLQNPKRTGSNVTTLMVGLILVIIVASVNWSFQSSIVGWFDRVIHADFLISSYGRIVAYQVQPLDENLGREIEKTPGILMGPERGAYALRFIHFQYQGHQLGLKAFDEPAPRDHYNYFYVRDRSNEEAGQELFHSQELTILVSENFVQHFKKKYGDTVELPSPSGNLKFKIVGVITDFASPEGVIYIDRKVYKKYWHDTLVEGFSISAQPGYSKDKLREDIDSRFGKKQNLMIISNNDMREQIVKSIDQGFGYTRAIEIAALAVALLSLLNTFLISVMERTRELGMLRAVGMTRSQMMSLILQESLVQGGFGALVAVVLGAWVAELWIVGSLSYVLGWIVHFSFPWQSVLTTMCLGIGVTLLAGIYPAWRAAHVEIREALEYE